MTRNELKELLKSGKKVVRWVKSGVVEVAFLTGTNNIIIQNAITKKAYCLPKRYNEVNIEIVPMDSHIALGSLLPKELR